MSKQRLRTVPSARRREVALAGLLALMALQAQAQDQAEGAADAPKSTRRFTVGTGLSVTETLTDNVFLSATDRRSELITQISPSVSMRSDAGRVQGSLNYSLNGLLYARESRSNAIQHALNASGKAMLVENFAFVDASASVSQQNISAFGAVAPGTGLLSGNQTQVSTWTLSPYVAGRLGGFATYDARLSYSETDSGTSSLGNSSNTLASIRLGSDAKQARLGWSVDGTHQVADFSVGRRTETDSLVGTLSYSPDYQWRLFARAGREISNLTTLQRQGHETYGAGVTWVPSPRTTFTATGDNHYYGNSHSLRFDHRMARFAWSISDMRSVNTNQLPSLRGVQTTAFELLYQSLASRFPNPAERTQQALLQLQALGIDPTMPALVGFLTSAATLQRSQNISASYLGLRTNFVVSAFQSWSSRLDTLSGSSDSLSGGGTVRQRGLSASASHQLTPASTLTLSASLTRTPSSASAPGGQGLDYRSLLLTWQGQVTRRASLSLSARHVQASSATNPYDESALIARLSLQF